MLVDAQHFVRVGSRAVLQTQFLPPQIRVRCSPDFRHAVIDRSSYASCQLRTHAPQHSARTFGDHLVANRHPWPALISEG
jgi:hypothetical protein